jgi:hypothetical protein
MTRRKLWSVALAGAALMAFSGPSFAQEQGRRGGGRGGFGGGGLLMVPEVQKELKLQQAQIDLLQGLRRGGGTQDRESLRNLSREERQKRFEAMRAQREKQIAEILDANQLKRLKQLEIQQQGIRAIARDEVANQLKLSAAQRQQVQTVIQAERDTMRQSFGGGRRGGGGQQGAQPGGQDRQQAFQRMREMRTQNDAKLNAILTDAQKKQFQTMQGPAFQFPERRRGRGPRTSTT